MTFTYVYSISNPLSVLIQEKRESCCSNIKFSTTKGSLLRLPSNIRFDIPGIKNALLKFDGKSIFIEPFKNYFRWLKYLSELDEATRMSSTYIPI